MTAARSYSDADMLVTLTRGELRDMLTEAVRAALDAKADDWIGPDEVAAMLGVARSTVPSLVARDGLPAARVARGYRFRRKEVVAWLEERIARPGGHARKHGAKLLSLTRR